MRQDHQNVKNISSQAKLMQRILEVRYTDLEEEKRLCKKLLELSEQERYFYGLAFANVYLVDSHLALGEYNSCDFYLMRAMSLCREYGFDDLMLMLCNCAGLYYQKLNDDQTALTYFLEGKSLAEQLGDIGMLGKLFNNIGYSFGRHKDLQSSRTYFELAYQTVEPHLEGENIRSAIRYLTNLAEICQALGDSESCRKALTRCEELSEDNAHSRIQLGCSWCAYYAAIGDFEHCAAIVDQLIESDLVSVEEQFFVCDMAEGLCNSMLDIGDQVRAKRLLDIILKLEYDTSLFLQHRIQCLKIRYWEACGATDLLEQAYRDYYETAMKIAVIEDETRAQSMISKLQINQAMIEREAMQQQMRALENASQLDELTGLYNRRYFNKLVSKVIQREEITQLGFIMLDVDYFKQYNDSYGHFKGDYALRAVARVLSRCADEKIDVSRYGGDEFVCLCSNLTDSQVEDYIGRVIEALRAEKIPHQTHPSSPILTISLGYCNEPFGRDVDTEELLNLADQALYTAKQRKRGTSERKTLA